MQSNWGARNCLARKNHLKAKIKLYFLVKIMVEIFIESFKRNYFEALCKTKPEFFYNNLYNIFTEWIPTMSHRN